MELMTYCLGGKTKKISTFLEILRSYIYVLVDYDTINNSGKYFTCRFCNLENIVKKL